ncbi:hypothetical protein [Paracoccus sp. SY]|uniref:hypothetical protein n=1 Tax=Paracoccus sp. SY TaxID=1330255 RepID=UPI001304CCDA|nr:hypothetical protein [Paracoccus sp. SY]
MENTVKNYLKLVDTPASAGSATRYWESEQPPKAGQVPATCKKFTRRNWGGIMC